VIVQIRRLPHHDGLPLPTRQTAGAAGPTDDIDQTVEQPVAMVYIPADVRIEFGNHLFVIYVYGSTTRSGGGSPVAKRYR